MTFAVPRWLGYGAWLLVAVGPRGALAGTVSAVGIAAVTPDGRYMAVYRDDVGSFEKKFCGLARSDPAKSPVEPHFHETENLLVRASCANGSNVAVLGQWAWEQPNGLVKSLVPFHQDGVASKVRIGRDPNTGLRRLEIQQRGQWNVVRADETSGISELTPADRYGSPNSIKPSTWQAVTGVIHGPNGYLIRLNHARMLAYWDELIAIPDWAISNQSSQIRAARDAALAATKVLRDQRGQSKGLFQTADLRPRAGFGRQMRRNDAIRRALLQWERAAAFAPLGAKDLEDALWLLAWLDAPTRRLEATRWYLSLNDRDANAASRLLARLSWDPDTQRLAAELETAWDPLRNLPEVTEHRLTDAELEKLSDEQIRWLHRAQWAFQGCYRFSDPTIQAYFEQFSWYAPIPEANWRTRRGQPYMRNPDAPLLNKLGTGHAGTSSKSLEAILRAERARGIEPPRL